MEGVGKKKERQSIEVEIKKEMFDIINNDYIMGFTGIWKYIPWREQKPVWRGSEKGNLNLFFFPISLLLVSPSQAVRTMVDLGHLNVSLGVNVVRGATKWADLFRRVMERIKSSRNSMYPILANRTQGQLWDTIERHCWHLMKMLPHNI